MSPALLAYLAALDSDFSGNDLGRAVGAYVFLERSAVELYAPLLQALSSVGVPKAALEFFRIHTEVELRHAGTTEALAERLGGTDRFRRAFDDEVASLENLWNGFWAGLLVAEAAAARS